MPQPVSSWSLHPAGDRSLVVVFHDDDPVVANRHASQLARGLAQPALPGVYAIVPGMVSVALHYEPDLVLDHAQAAGAPVDVLPYDCLARQVSARVVHDDVAAPAGGREIVLPVCYGGEHGPDLDEVAESCGMSPAEVVALHTAAPVNVFMLGFAPGHPYIGRFDARLNLGRRSSPRTEVPVGSVGLSNRQSVIYPMRMPGGWHLIGRTPLALFDVQSDPPVLLQAGDRLRFQAITQDEFERLAARGEGR